MEITMKWSKVWNRVSWLFYKTTSVPSRMVGWGLSVHNWLREDDSVNEANVEGYHRPTSRYYYR